MKSPTLVSALLCLLLLDPLFGTSPPLRAQDESSSPKPVLQTKVWSSIAAFSPDGTALAVAADKGVIRRWDIATGREISPIAAHSRGILALTFSDDGHWLASAGVDDGVKIKLWDARSGFVIRILDGDVSAVRSMAMSADGRWLATAGSYEDRTVRVWETSTGRIAWALTLDENNVFFRPVVTFSPDGRYLALSGSETWNVTLYEAASGKEARVLQGQVWSPYALAFSSDGRLLAVGGAADRGPAPLQLWEVGSGRSLGLLKGPESITRRITFGSDSRWLVASGFHSPGGENPDKTELKILELPGGREMFSIRFPGDSRALAPEGRWVAGAPEGSVVVWPGLSASQLQALAGEAERVQAVRSAARPSTCGQPASHSANPELVLQTGHSDVVWALAFSPDGCWLASSGLNEAVLWELPSGRQVRVLELAGANQIAFSPDGRWLAAPTEKSVRMWEVSTGRQVRFAASGKGDHRWLRFSPDGRWLVSWVTESGGVWQPKPGQILVWEVATAREVARLPHSNQINAVAFSPDGRWLAAGGWDESVSLWELPTGRRVQTFPGQGSTVEALTFSPDGRWLAFASSVQVQVWNTSGVAPPRTLMSGSRIAVPALAFASNGQSLAVGTLYRTKILDVATGKEQLSLETSADWVSFTPDGRALATAGSEDMRLWDVATGRGLHPPSRRIRSGSAYAVSSDGRWLASVDIENRHSIKLWDLPNALELQTLVRRTAPLLQVATAGHWLVAGPPPRGSRSRDQAVRVWDMAAGLLHYRMEAREIGTVAASPDGRTLAMARKDDVALVDVTTGSVLRRLPHRSAALLQFGAAGRLLAVGTEPFTFFDPSDGRQVYSFTPPANSSIHAAALSPDGRSLLTSESGVEFAFGLRIRDLPTGKELSSIRTNIVDLVFSPDTQFAAGFIYDEPQQLKLWETASGKEKFALPGSAGVPKSFSPDSRILATATYQHEIKLFDSATGRGLRTLTGHTSVVDSIQFTNNGRWMVSSSGDNSARIWDPATGEQVVLLAAMEGTDDWIVVTPDGLFDGSLHAVRELVAWRFGTEMVPPEVFFNEFDYPGLLADVLAGRKPRAPRSLSQLDRRQPEVKLASGSTQPAASSVPSRTISLTLEIAEAPADAQSPSGSGARDVRLFRNGSLVKVWRGDVLKGQKQVTLEATVPIVAGVNRFTAYAFNKDNIKSSDVELVVTGAESLRRKGTAYVLAIGINQYANKDYNLNYAVADAQAFAEELARQQTKLGEYAKVEVVPLLDKDATKTNLLAALKRLAGEAASTSPPASAPSAAAPRPGTRRTPVASRPASAPQSSTAAKASSLSAVLAKLQPAQPEDAVFVYYAGHGTASGPRFYLIPHDLGYSGSRTEIDEAGLKAVLEHSISDRDLEQAFEKIDAGRLLLVIDACNSGQALEAEEKRRGPMNSKGLAQLAYEKGMYILTAAQGYQAALEAAQLGHGYLTYALVEEGLKTPSADSSPKDGEVMMREWLDYATLRVPQMQEQGMQEARKLGRNIAMVEGEEKIDDPAKRSLQRPRVFYRREPEAQPLVVARP
ncbi:MAG: caspase family protein [Terriglobales bacterium]